MKSKPMSSWIFERIPTDEPAECTAANALSEEQSHREHRAALEATVFGRALRDELIFELEAGRLRLCGRCP